MFSVFAGCQIPYPKREFLTEEEPEDKADKVGNVFFLLFEYFYVSVNVSLFFFFLIMHLVMPTDPFRGFSQQVFVIH